MKATRTIATALVSLGLTVAAAGCGGNDATIASSAKPIEATTTTAPVVERPTEAVDRLVPIGADGARMHLVCSGSGDSTVVMISGFGGSSESWTAVTPEIHDARTCTYDRFGLGTSDAPTSDQTFVSQAEDLHALLEAAGEPGPYVVVGHSFGGSEAVAFAHHHADEVQGLMLVDASPTDWPEAACGVPDDGTEVAASFAQSCQMFDPTGNPEHLDARKAFGDVAKIDTLGDLPMTVLTRADVTYDGLDAATNELLATTWNDGQAHWTSLSSAAELIRVQDTGHSIQDDQPQVVIDNLQALLDR